MPRTGDQHFLGHAQSSPTSEETVIAVDAAGSIIADSGDDTLLKKDFGTGWVRQSL